VVTSQGICARLDSSFFLEFAVSRGLAAAYATYNLEILVGCWQPNHHQPQHNGFSRKL
jgi:hypothetical protein